MTIENQPVEPPAAIAERVGNLVTTYLSPPYYAPGSMAGGSAVEDAAVERWRQQLGADAAKLWAEVAGRDPEAVRLVELIQCRAGFVPGSARAIRSDEETREKYRLEMPRIFR